MTESLLSEEILADNADVWTAMQDHRFVADIAADRLDPEVFRRYLVYENAFVETALSIFGYLLVKAPALDERRRIVGVLQALSEEQIPYFEQTFRDLGLASADASTLHRPLPVLAFQQGMLSYAAHGTYAEGVTAMFAAEWMYWHWCQRAMTRPISDPVLRRWVSLHTQEGFVSQARWLKQQIDAAGAHLDPVGRRRLSAVFRQALRFEIDFHSAPYLPPSE